MMTELVGSRRCYSLPPACCAPAVLPTTTQRAGHVDSMTSSPPTSGRDDAEKSDINRTGQKQQQRQRLSFGISQILQCDDDDDDDHPRRYRDAISGGSGDATAASTMALIRSAFGSYVSGAAAQAGGSVPGLVAGGLYGGSTPGVIRVPAQRLSTAGVCVPQPATAAAAAACRLSAMMFPWMRERKDGLTCTYLASSHTAISCGGGINGQLLSK